MLILPDLLLFTILAWFDSRISLEFIAGDPERYLSHEYTQLDNVVVQWLDTAMLIYRHTEPFANMYSIPGRHKEAGETYLEAASKELREGTGIATDELEPWLIFLDHQHRLECHAYRVKSKDGTFDSPEVEEQDVVGWKTQREAMRLPLTPGLHKFLRRQF